MKVKDKIGHERGLYPTYGDVPRWKTTSGTRGIHLTITFFFCVYKECSSFLKDFWLYQSEGGSPERIMVFPGRVDWTIADGEDLLVVVVVVARPGPAL